jgi:hypothetical protein
MSDSTQLRRCPFCWSDEIEPARRSGFPVQATCLNCGAEGPTKLTGREADIAWNGLREWSPDAPTDEGTFWFCGDDSFGSMGGHYTGSIQPRNEIHLVVVRKISNGVIAVTNGHFMSLTPFNMEKRQSGYLGLWQKADLPPMP